MNPMPTRRRSPEANSQLFDVQLLDLFAEVEAILRGGRELQRDALRMRAIAPTSGAQRRAATQRIQKRVRQMRKECLTLCNVLQGLADRADDLSDGQSRR
jgi:hypothetical protein